jgi:hypothetical protein
MALKKIWISRPERTLRASYAELNLSNIDDIVAQQVGKVSGGARFYKVESETGSFVGYFIMNGIEIVDYYERPHFFRSQEFRELMFETRDSRFQSTVGTNNFFN